MTAKERDQKIDALRIQQQRSRTKLGGFAQSHRDGLRRGTQLAISQSRSCLLPINEELVRQLIGQMLRAVAQ